ncbi:uncharacterized protein ISCGN_006784 [Ixodes scapularis]
MGSKLKQPDRPPKRGRTEALSTFLKQDNSEDHFTRFFVLHSDDTSKPLSKLSPFLVAKTLQNTLGAKYEAKKLFSGDLLVEIHERYQATALLNLKMIHDLKVTASAHRTLNTIRGVISEDDLLTSSEEEIVEGLSTQGVVAAKRIKIRKDGEERLTKHVILTFEKTSLPPTVKAGYINCKVRPYVPNPLRCFRCQRYGHGSRACRGRETCARCSGTDHTADNCNLDYKCANCNADHPAYSRSCNHFKKEKEILALKVKENISYQDAKCRLSAFQKGSFAEAVSSRGPAPSKVSVATQVSFSDHWKPLQSSMPRLKLALPGHSISAAKAADPTSRTKDIGAAAATEVTPSSLPPGPSPQAMERVSRSSSPGRTSPSRRQHVPRATDDTGGTTSRPSTSTVAPSGQCRGRGLPLRSVDSSKASGRSAKKSLEAEKTVEAGDLSAPEPEPEDMEWQTQKPKHKGKTPVFPPK